MLGWVTLAAPLQLGVLCGSQRAAPAGSHRHVGGSGAGVAGWRLGRPGELRPRNACDAAHPAAAQTVHRRVPLPAFELPEATFKTVWQPTGGSSMLIFQNLPSLVGWALSALGASPLL